MQKRLSTHQYTMFWQLSICTTMGGRKYELTAFPAFHITDSPLFRPIVPQIIVCCQETAVDETK